jgi:hypothetical protein
VGSTPAISLMAYSPYELSCEALDNTRGWMGVDSAGATLQQVGPPDTAAKDASQCCEALIC